MTDPVAAVVEALSGLADGRVFGGSLPTAQREHMPRQVIIVRSAGGAGIYSGGYQPVVDDRVDVRVYGATDWEASQLSREASLILHHAQNLQTEHGRIIWARRAGGPVDLVEPSTTWPLVFTSWQVFGPWLQS